MGSLGSDLIQQVLNTGGGDTPTPAAVDRVRSEVTPSLTELLDVGARIRPLLYGGSQVGFVRAVHSYERRILFSWFKDVEDRLHHLIKSGTTLTDAEVDSLDGHEARYLVDQINKITDADVSLFPYIYAYSTTAASDMLWYSLGAKASSWSNKVIKIPGGYSFDLPFPSEHSRLWVSISTGRDRARHRLDANYNSAMITRALVGKGADKLYRDLHKTQESLASDNDDAWMQVVTLDKGDIDFTDGWGHAHQDDSVEGVIREADGMNAVDKHEKFFEDHYRRQQAAADAEAEVKRRRFERATEDSGIYDVMSIMTSAQMREMDEQERRDRMSVEDQADNVLRRQDTKH